MPHSRRIICDVDDTISQTFNRDWENALPVQEVIDKINYLYDQGWEIFLVTARGQLSCNGDSKKADEKYRIVMEGWLARHGVKYHNLSFEKQLATYYIDDKALMPKDFLDLKIKKISSGWSGAIVEQRGDRVYKTHNDSLTSAEWYSVASKFINVPKVHSVIGDTICLDFIPNEGYLRLDEVVNVIQRMSLLPPYKGGGFLTYIYRVKQHCIDYPDFQFIIERLSRIIGVCDKHQSFSHGDLSHENVLVDGNGKHYLIDPILKIDGYSSYLLDYTKLMYSFHRDNMMFEYSYVRSLLSKIVSTQVIDILEATQWIRVYKYAPESMKSFIYDKIRQFDKNVPENRKFA